MTTPLPALALPFPASTITRRKRSRSSVEIFSLSPPYDTKRARIGIQELSTGPTPSLHTITPTVESSSLEEPETQESESYSSEDSDMTSSSGSEGSSEDEADQGYDSDSESGSTSTSSSSSSSDSDSSDSARIMTSPTPARNERIGNATSLSSRLSSFLPAIAAANAQLESERRNDTTVNRNIEDIDGENYIEMDLGLGVLEEKNLDKSSSDTDSDDGNDGDDSDSDEKKSTPRERKTKKREKDVMSKLMGKERGKRPGIEVMDDDSS
jgi:hypothetical protein